MDPVSVFNALYDTKCLKFGRFDLKSGTVAPFYINLRRLPLYPKLMDAVVTQVVEKFLSGPALAITSSQVRRQARNTTGVQKQESINSLKGAKDGDSTESDADSQLEDEIEMSSDDNSASEKDPEPILCGVPYGAVPIAMAIACKTKLPYLFHRHEPKSYGDPQSLMPAGKQQRVILIEDVISSGASVLETIESLAKENIRVEFVICIVDREQNGVNLLLEQAGIRVVSLYNISAILRILEATGRISSAQFICNRQWLARNQFEQIGVAPTTTPSAKSSPSKVAADLTSTKRTSNTIEVAAN